MNYRHKAFQASALPLSYPGDWHYSIDTHENANQKLMLDLYLSEFELHWCITTEEVDIELERAFFLVYFDDFPFTSSK